MLVHNMRVALVHDYLTQFGGGERVLSALCEMFPEAPIYTLIYDEKGTGGAFKNREIHTSFLQKIPGSKKYFRGLIWLMPLAIEQFDFAAFDAVISVSHSYGKGIITKPTTKHICYCLTPIRYLWPAPRLLASEGRDARFLNTVSRPILNYLKKWDYRAAQRVDYFISNSENVRQRIKKYYNCESEIIYSPVETEKFYISSEPKDYFLMVGRMVPYKRFDIAIKAFNKLPQEELLIIGDWPFYSKLKAMTKVKTKNIKFLGKISDSELPKYYASCQALIFPQEEDFGLVPLEAMASGRPVIAFRAGGALETVIENKTGLFFDEQKTEHLLRAIQSFRNLKYNPQEIRKHSQLFDKEIFKSKVLDFLNTLTRGVKDVIIKKGGV